MSEGIFGRLLGGSIGTAGVPVKNVGAMVEIEKNMQIDRIQLRANLELTKLRIALDLACAGSDSSVKLYIDQALNSGEYKERRAILTKSHNEYVDNIKKYASRIS